MDPQRAVRALQRDRGGASLAAVQQSLRAGATLPRALAEHRLATANEAGVLMALDGAGRLDRGLLTLAAARERIDAIVRRIRSGLVLPLALVVLAAFIAPLPAVFAGALSGPGYVWAVVRPLVVVFGLLWLVPFVLTRSAPWLEAGWMIARGRLPLHRRWALFHQLGSMLEAGLDAATALEQLASHARGAVAHRLGAAQGAIAAGEPVTAALQRQRLVDPRTDAALLQAGEAGGRLPEVLQQRADTLGGQLKGLGDTVAAWLPRVLYLLALGYIAANVLSAPVTPV